ncbi:MAG: hypothetical protein RBT38_09590 [Bacteroidales bacterium]|jgi:hypothetical protein|nr:hypothetical protein [Bacteroidales bacterium]
MNQEDIKILLEKYYEGSTSSEEELLLKRFFSSKEVPEEFRHDNEIFRFFLDSAEIPEAPSGLEERIIIRIDRERAEAKLSKKHRIIAIISAAAVLIIIISAAWFLTRHKGSDRDTYSDPQIAYAEAIKILYEVSVKLNKGTSALGKIGVLESETINGLQTVHRSTSLMKEKIRPLDDVFTTMKMIEEGKTGSVKESSEK